MKTKPPYYRVTIEVVGDGEAMQNSSTTRESKSLEDALCYAMQDCEHEYRNELILSGLITNLLEEGNDFIDPEILKEHATEWDGILTLSHHVNNDLWNKQRKLYPPNGDMA